MIDGNLVAIEEDAGWNESIAAEDRLVRFFLSFHIHDPNDRQFGAPCTYHHFLGYDMRIYNHYPQGPVYAIDWRNSPAWDNSERSALRP
jgi:hypothetical protein